MSVPYGISFGRSVVVLPYADIGFRHSGSITSTFKRGYHWVKRGDTLAKFEISGSTTPGFFSNLFDSSSHSAPIRSPVSGLLLSPTFPWIGSSSEDSLVAILIPDDEPIPETGEYIFGPMCDVARSMRHYYIRASRYYSYSAMTAESFESLLRQQRNSRTRTHPALPRWSEYFDEARTNQPELRPYLKHLR